MGTKEVIARRGISRQSGKKKHTKKTQKHVVTFHIVHTCIISSRYTPGTYTMSYVNYMSVKLGNICQEGSCLSC